MSGSIIVTPKVYPVEGDFFTKYKLKVEKVLDEGMCGEIVLAIPLEKPEAHRVVKKFTLLDEEHRIRNMEAFHAEVQFMQSCNHRFITKCIIAAQCTDYLAICTYYYPRGTLDSYVGHLDLQLSELCIIQVACALRYLHRNNVVHLDIKLDNIFLDGEFNAILGDFGLAMALQPHQKTVKKSECGGTPCYYAPERRGAPDDKQLDPYKVSYFIVAVCYVCCLCLFLLLLFVVKSVFFNCCCLLGAVVMSVIYGLSLVFSEQNG